MNIGSQATTVPVFSNPSRPSAHSFWNTAVTTP